MVIKTSVLVDIMEIVNSIKDSKRTKNPKIIMPLLLDPEFIGRERNEITGESMQKFKLKNLELLGIEYDVQPLSFGDYIIPTTDDDDEPMVDIIERKTVADLIGSFTAVHGKGKIRVDDQLKKCMKGGKLYYDNYRVTLLIEDFYECRFDFSETGLGVWIPYKINYGKKVDRKGNPVYSNAWYSKRLINPSSLLGKIKAFEEWGIKVDNEYEKINVVKCGGAQHAYNYLIKLIVNEPERKKSLKAIRLKPTGMEPSEEIEFILQGFSGIGGELADRLLEHDPVLINLFNEVVDSESHKHVGVSGFGSDTFNKMKDALTREWISKDKRKTILDENASKIKLKRITDDDS